MNLLIKQRLTDSENKLMVTSGEGIVREFGMDMYTLLFFKMDNQQRPTVEHTELCSMLCSSLDGTRIWGRMYV